MSSKRTTRSDTKKDRTPMIGHLATNMEELNELSEIDKSDLMKNIKRYSNSLKSLFKKGQFFIKNRRAEDAYVMFMKFCAIYLEISKIDHSETDFDMNYFTSLYYNDFNSAMTEAGKLSMELMSRYSEMNKINSDDIDKSLQKDEDLKTEVKVPDPIEPPVRSISVKEVYRLLSEGKDLLLVDIRTEAQYEASRIDSPTSINISADKHISKSCTLTKIRKLLTPKVCERFRNFQRYHTVVVFDYDGTYSGIKPFMKLNSILEAFTKWDKPTTCHPLVMELGFEEWSMRYPTKTLTSTCPNGRNDNSSAMFDHDDDLSKAYTPC